MTSNYSVRAEGLGKRYTIFRDSARRYTALRDVMMERAKSLSGRLLSGSGDRSGSNREDFWALKDLDFVISQGERVGIIGRNGAGKSTLLKVMSRITEPTSGTLRVRGRVASLLEVGTGFHPELTGRENIYLNGAVLGMRRKEIRSKFDEIVNFAEVEKFLDTPVKRYSSGMYVRLAFAVAAHLEPEILIVDEVLAVGDSSFQRKCLNKMEDVGQSGRTVIFVSHDLGAVARLCERAMLLDSGRLVKQGTVHDVVRTYLESGTGTTSIRRWGGDRPFPGDAVSRLRSVRAITQDGKLAETVDIRRAVGLEMTYDVLEDGHVLVPNYHIFNDEGICVFVAHDLDPTWRGRPRAPGRYVSTAWIPGNLLAEGTLRVGAAVSTHNPVVVHFFERDAIAFQVVDSLDGDSARGDYGGMMPGIVRPALEWTTASSFASVAAGKVEEP
jgi:lipopolysaccharide transport system ATP-binding protein